MALFPWDMNLWAISDAPSIRPSSMAPTDAPVIIGLLPALEASSPPVQAPAMMAFQGSSFFRRWMNVQSNEQNENPHMANAPPVLGALSRMFVNAPENRYPLGAFLIPLAKCHTPPPTKPIPKAPPISSRILYGHGWPSIGPVPY
eukprot:CAMPEP_0167773910 /NCGR_PEP_ID=MMETSP0111_2-20121227/1701_1 /TAXON_ID=91324 /ORGANISM="Lotharella globosa, Strain CCCM811" /LENGTH=144 /DNA_ID=CAMNT_0007663637 /DNA_START=162 /DNA_END=593 /DNA_ORIENTATION=-